MMIMEPLTLTLIWKEMPVATLEPPSPTGVILDGTGSPGMNPEHVSRMVCGVDNHFSVKVIIS